MYSKAAKVAILDFITGTALLVLFLYGVYMVWYVIMVYLSAFLGDDLLKFKPSGDDHNPTLEELAEINPDVIGWITIDDTKIDYPIVQGKDNLEYLNLNVYREYSLAGTVFLDVNNEKNFSDPYNILYGHHMDYGLKNISRGHCICWIRPIRSICLPVLKSMHMIQEFLQSTKNQKKCLPFYLM